MSIPEVSPPDCCQGIFIENARKTRLRWVPLTSSGGGRWFAAKPQAVTSGWDFAATLLRCVLGKYSILAADFLSMYGIVLAAPASTQQQQRKI